LPVMDFLAKRLENRLLSSFVAGLPASNELYQRLGRVAALISGRVSLFSFEIGLEDHHAMLRHTMPMPTTLARNGVAQVGARPEFAFLTVMKVSTMEYSQNRG